VRVNRTRTAIIALGALALVGCQLLKKKDDKILGSCTRPNDTFSGGTSRCRERKGYEPACLAEETKSDKPCPRDGFIVAGCRENSGFKEVEWIYSDPAKGGTATVQSVGTYCVSIAKGTTLMPDGSEKSSTDVVGDEVKKYEATHGAKARTTLANVATIAAKLPAATGKVDLQGLKGDALLVHKEDLGNLESPKKLEYRIEEAGQLAACSRMLNKRQLASDKGYDIEYCAKDPFIAVLEVDSYNPPTATGTSVSGNTKTTYVKKGTITGDVYFFRSDNGKYLGSTKIFVSNDDNSATLPQIMTEHLLEKWPGALHAQMKQAAPGMTNIDFKLKKN
jgi:hypothetical protein